MASLKTTKTIAARYVAIAFMVHCFSEAARGAEPVEWLTDLEQAKQVAAKNGKDLLINFTGLGWCGSCMELEREVLATEEFAPASRGFVLVRLDYPSGVERLPLEPPAPHASWQGAYGVKGFPTVFLTDAKGRPYAVTGNLGMGPKEYVKHLSELRKIHQHRDDGFSAAEKREGIERARSLAGALRSLAAGFEDGSESLENSNLDILVRFYRDEIDTVMRLDADNAAGLRAHFDDLLHRVDRLAEDEAFFNLLRNVDKANKGADEAMRLLDKRIAETDSPWIRNRARRARLSSLEWAKRHEEALAYARELAADESYSLEDRRWLRTRVAWNLWRLHRNDEAVAVLDRLIADIHDNPRQQCRYLCDKAEWGLWDAGRYMEALETLSAAIKLVKPDTVEWLRVQGWRANYLERLGRVADACAVYETLIASKVSGPIDRADCLTAMAKMLDNHGSHDAALDAAARAQQVLDHEVTSPATNSVAQLQSQINTVTGAKPAETKSKTTQGKNNP